VNDVFKIIIEILKYLNWGSQNPFFKKLIILARFVEHES
jgi:hypothetical protein